MKTGTAIFNPVDLPGEVWRSIPDFPDYRVSNKGRIKSLARIDARGWCRKERLLTPVDAQIRLTNYEGKHLFPLGALILQAFIGPAPNDKPLARHLNDDRSNNDISNLAWGSDKDNRADALRNGRRFDSYGHLGKHHSEETKQRLRDQRLGKNTGTVITEEHKTALLAGYRLKFPEKEIPTPKPCGCGCGRLASPGKTFCKGHHIRKGKKRNFKRNASTRV